MNTARMSKASPRAPRNILRSALATGTVAITLLATQPVATDAQVTFEYIGNNVYGTDISADGTVVVGNTAGAYETFRWTAETGIELLGRPSTLFFGGAGTPNVSSDGTRVCGSILGADSTYWTQGVWTLGSGWQETMPPVPPDGGLIDNSYGSAWSISGDGNTVVGLYWRPGQPGGSAHPSTWSSSTGLIDLGTTSGSGRANDVSEDGSVVVGWEERTDGVWRPTAWVDGVRVTLTDYEAFTEASVVTPDGSIIAGLGYAAATNRFGATVWRWDGFDWIEEYLGALPGTAAGTFGLAYPNGISADGSVIVGYNQFSNPNNATGFMWREGEGLINIETFLQENGIVIDPTFNIQSLNGISADGQTMVGSGQLTVAPFTAKTFLIRIQDPAAVPAELATTAMDLRVYPNPALAHATVDFELLADRGVRLGVFDAAGALVRQLVDDTLAGGRHRIEWDGTDLRGRTVPAGVYFIKWSSGPAAASRRIVLAR